MYKHLIFGLLLITSFVGSANAGEELPKVPFDISDIVSACSSIKVYVTDGALYKTETLDKFLTSQAKKMCIAPLKFPRAFKPNYDRGQYQAYADYYSSLVTPQLTKYMDGLKARGTYVSIIGKSFFAEKKQAGTGGFSRYVETGKYLWYTSAGGGYLSVNKSMNLVNIGMFTGTVEAALRSKIAKWIKQQQPSF